MDLWLLPLTAADTLNRYPQSRCDFRGGSEVRTDSAFWGAMVKDSYGEISEAVNY